MADLPLRKSRWLIPLPCRIRKCEQNKRQDHIYREAEYTSDGSYGGGKLPERSCNLKMRLLRKAKMNGTASTLSRVTTENHNQP